MVVRNVVERSLFQLPILKVRPGSRVEGVLGEVGPLWFGVHWVAGRQYLCGCTDEDGCALCSLGSSRVVGLTMIELEIKGRRHEFLLEMSPLAFSQFQSRLRFANLDLKTGIVVELSRSRARSALRIEPLQIASGWQMWLDGERRLLNAWAVLYGMPLSTSEETVDVFMLRIQSVIQARARLVVPKAL